MKRHGRDHEALEVLDEKVERAQTIGVLALFALVERANLGGL